MVTWFSVRATVAGRNVFIRFVCFAGDAMGMNMVSKVRARLVHFYDSQNTFDCIYGRILVELKLCVHGFNFRDALL